MFLTTKPAFSLIELIVSIAILSIISIISVRLLSDTLTTRSAVSATLSSSDTFRSYLIELSSSLQSAASVSLPNPHTLSITGHPCRIVRLNSTRLEQALDTTAACLPAAFSPISPSDMTISDFTVTSLGANPDSFTLTVTGTTKDSFNSYPFTFSTTVSTRVTL